MKKIFVINSIFLYRKLNPKSELRHCINTSLVALWNFLSFRVSQFVTSLEPPVLTFYNLALFSIYGNDGTTISTEVNPCRKLKLRTMILFISNSVLFFRQKFVISTFESSVFFIFVFFQPHKNKEVKSGYSIYIMEWKSNSSYPYIKYITLYPQIFNVLWRPTLVLLSQTCFLLLLSGRYGYDINCWFQAMMNINGRNELLSSCLGSLHQKLDS